MRPERSRRKDGGGAADTIIELRRPWIEHKDFGTTDWVGARQIQADEFRLKVAPLLSTGDPVHIAYFGMAPIPLAVDLGYRVGAHRTASIFQRRHDDGTWHWRSQLPSDKLRITSISGGCGAGHDAIVHIATRTPISPAITNVAVPSARIVEDVTTAPFAEDSVESEETLSAVLEAAKGALHRIEQDPAVESIHLFAAIPVGVAFGIGRLVNPTMHPLHVYQYWRSDTLPYRHAFRLQDDGDRAGTVPGAAGPAGRSTRRVRLCILSDDTDRVFRDRLAKHLVPLLKEGAFEVPEVLPGEERIARWKAEIDRADAVIVLLSADWLASDDWSALEATLKEKERVMPLPVRACSWQIGWMGERTPLFPEPLKGPDDDAAWIRVVEQLQSLKGT